MLSLCYSLSHNGRLKASQRNCVKTEKGSILCATKEKCEHCLRHKGKCEHCLRHKGKCQHCLLHKRNCLRHKWKFFIVCATKEKLAYIVIVYVAKGYISIVFAIMAKLSLSVPQFSKILQILCYALINCRYVTAEPVYIFALIP